MKMIAKGKLKAKMLEYFCEVERISKEIIVTDNGRPSLRVIPF
ncbi:MAG: hypothetical protein M2R45_04345 [Verrucomicrobia subdivision 3 bacterium]|nr:hypothetical protein [Limisphaerales bacterium]MCS1416049.1 hypothetical protein [Limisphaerales bacterium]